MVEARDRLLPGTSTTYFGHGERGFTKIEMLLTATGGLSLSQVCSVTGLEATTIQNWVKRGWVANPRGKKYDEVHIARILLINALKDCIKLERIAQLMCYVNGATEDRSNEIIKESEMFNYLCDALEALGQVDGLPRSGVERIVEGVIKGYSDPVPDSREKVRKALTVMIYACVCTNVKRRTETMLGYILHNDESGFVSVESVAAEKPSPDRSAPVKPTQQKPVQDKPVQDKSVQGKSAQSKPAQSAPVQSMPPQDKPLPDMAAQYKPASDKPVPDKAAAPRLEEVEEINRPPRKTISQALREWDKKSEEIPPTADETDEKPPETAAENPAETPQSEGAKPPAPDSHARPFARPVYFRKN